MNTEVKHTALPGTKALVLRVNDKNGKSHGGFQWPLEVGATVAAPDWEKNTECGNGLHGWLYGAGDHSCTDRWSKEGALWYVVEVELGEVMMLGGKCKFPSCVIRHIGDKKTVTDYLWEHELQSRSCAVIGAQRADLRDGVMACWCKLAPSAPQRLATEAPQRLAKEAPQRLARMATSASCSTTTRSATTTSAAPKLTA